MAKDPFGPALKAVEDIAARNITRGMKAAATALKEDYRDQIEKAGLGKRLGRTWQAKTYPQSGQSLDPAGYVYSKAPLIMDSMIAPRNIVPTGGRKYLAIPTANVPRKGRGLMSPEEVENAYNQDLVIRPAKNGRNLLGFVNVIPARNKKGFRRASKSRLASGRPVKLVLMFVFVPLVRTKQRLQFEATAEKWAAQVPDLIAQDWSA